MVSQPAITVIGPGEATLTNGTTLGDPMICPAPTTCLNQVHSGNYAAMLYSGYGDDNHADWASIQQTDTVPATQTVLTVWFAAVLEGFHYLSEDTTPSSDSEVEFDVQVNGSTVFSQQYSWYVDYPPPMVTAPLAPPLPLPIYPVTLLYDGAVNFYATNSGTVTWAHLPWTQYAYDFSAYVGQQVTIKYTASDCVLSGHYCYGYLDDVAWNNSSAVTNVTPVCTPTATSTPCGWPGDTCTATPTVTPTPTDTGTPTPTFTNTFTGTNTPTPTFTSTATPTRTSTGTPTSTSTPTATDTPCGYPGYTCTPTPTPAVVDIFYVSKNVFVPSNPVSIFVEYSLYPGFYELRIYNSAGEHIKTLDSRFLEGPVSQSYLWDGTNKYGDSCASGVYLINLVEPFGTKTKRVLWVK